MQALLRNPLADPYILGISGGAAVGALGAMLIGTAALVTPAALVGALASTLIVFGLARTGAERAPWTTTRTFLLTGVVVAAGWGAVIALLLTLAPDVQVKGMLFWLIGDLGGTTVAAPALVTLAIVLVASLASARDLNVLLRAARRWRPLLVLRVDARPPCSVRSRRSRPRRRSPPPAAWGSSALSFLTVFGLSSATISGSCCQQACSPVERCSCSPTRWRARSPRRFNCPWA